MTTPKRAPSAYNYLTKCPNTRDDIKAAHPEWQLENGKWSQPDFMAEYAKRWKAMSPEEKKPYDDQAAEAKANFTPPSPKEESNDNQPTQVAKKASSSWMHYLHDPDIRIPLKIELYKQKISESTDLSEEDRSKLEELNFDEFDDDMEKLIKEIGIKVKPTDITKPASVNWKSFGEEEKKPWVNKADQEKIELEKNPIMKLSKKKSKKILNNRVEESANDEISQLKNQVHLLAKMLKSQVERIEILEKSQLEKSQSEE
jgi:hypothetical protein